uniref:Cyclophilin n=1 Tax=Kwoniella bestiolae CBS 10118 TaxID=1296100 RepID=A0A1B9G200_9TREE|nr:cyclophilin [Kwoniella bestiolae CBS 10118]OCF25052.1 cyclophilin [Kwoniella bestiolae CBS 10118]
MQNDTAINAPSGSNKKSTVYVAGLAPEVNEDQLLSAFVTFVSILLFAITKFKFRDLFSHPCDHAGGIHSLSSYFVKIDVESKHRGFAFITFSLPSDAQDAIDNFDLNELPGYQGRGRFLKCSLANPDRFASEGGGSGRFDKAIWATDEWQQAHGEKPRDEVAVEGQ